MHKYRSTDWSKCDLKKRNKERNDAMNWSKCGRKKRNKESYRYNMIKETY